MEESTAIDSLFSGIELTTRASLSATKLALEHLVLEDPFLKALTFLVAESGEFESEMEVADSFDRRVDVEYKGRHHADLVAHDCPVALDVPVSLHVVHGVHAVAEVLVVHEYLELVDDEE